MGKIYFELKIDEEINSADHLMERLRTIFPSACELDIIGTPENWGPLECFTSEQTDPKNITNVVKTDEVQEALDAIVPIEVTPPIVGVTIPE